MKSSRKTIQFVLLAVIIVLGAGATYYYFEWEKPKIVLDKAFDVIGKEREITLTITDGRSGICPMCCQARALYFAG